MLKVKKIEKLKKKIFSLFSKKSKGSPLWNGHSVTLTDQPKKETTHTGRKFQDDLCNFYPKKAQNHEMYTYTDRQRFRRIIVLGTRSCDLAPTARTARFRVFFVCKTKLVFFLL